MSVLPSASLALEYFTIFSGVIILFCLLFVGIDTSLSIFPLFMCSLFFFYTLKVRHFNGWLFSYMLLTMVSEYLFLEDFETYALHSGLLNNLGELALVLALKPIIMRLQLNHIRPHLIELIVGLVGLILIIGLMLEYILPVYPYPFFLKISVILFIGTILICFLIPVLHKNHLNILLWSVGGGICLGMISAFIYQFYNNNLVFLFVSYLSVMVAKYALVKYLIQMPRIIREKGILV